MLFEQASRAGLGCERKIEDIGVWSLGIPGVYLFGVIRHFNKTEWKTLKYT